VCAKGCVEEPKGKVNKSLAIQTLQSSRLAPTNVFANQWNTKKSRFAILYQISCHYMCQFIKGRRYNIFATKMLLHW
jgi:hypothetical protein